MQFAFPEPACKFDVEGFHILLLGFDYFFHRETAVFAFGQAFGYSFCKVDKIFSVISVFGRLFALGSGFQRFAQQLSLIAGVVNVILRVAGYAQCAVYFYQTVA